MATFYVIGTPIGNLEDITLRALRIFKEVDLVLCEDTRVTRTLFSKYGITTPTMSYHAQSALSKTDTILEMLVAGKNIALVSDAGTPGISDPGSMLVSKIREHFNTSSNDESNSIKIESVPGPSALTAALSIAGVPCADFVFLGFLPHKKGRETLFKEMMSSERTTVFYESPHRIMKALESIVAMTGEMMAEKTDEKNAQKIAPKKITICRELTKIFEQVVAGSPQEILAYFTQNPDKIRGEFVVIVSA
ncbi:MAG: uroporphyrin-III C/tetrapyrrole (Corrin/Porphyrin) methyltransferase, rRNA [Candidatus Parcubacteria bacterium]|jgi:16S rRNA (cytidine1402-2'-O)-methyltransferase